jgi:DNA-binding NarL/FixJ family response regulator
VHGTNILLSDDNSGVLEHVRKMLEREKCYKVVGAISDGRVVVTEYFRLRPDVIILDISMGELNGIDIGLCCEITVKSRPAIGYQRSAFQQALCLAELDV